MRRPMDASSPCIMTCRGRVISGGSPAPSSVYADPYARLPARRGLPADPLETPRTWTRVPRRTLADAPVLRRRTHHLAVRCLQATARGPLRRGRAPGPVGDTPGLRRVATAAPPGLGRSPAQSPPHAAAIRGPRPGIDPLPRPAPARSRGDLPQQTQERDQALP